MSENSYLSRAAFFEADATKTDVVDLPEMGKGAQLRIRELTALEAENLGYASKEKDGSDNVHLTKGMTFQVISWAVIDDEGKPIFNKGDVQRLHKIPSPIVSKIAEAILNLSGLGETLAQEYVCPECGKEFAVAADLSKVAKLNPVCVKCDVAFEEKGKGDASPNA